MFVCSDYMFFWYVALVGLFGVVPIALGFNWCPRGGGLADMQVCGAVEDHKALRGACQHTPTKKTGVAHMAGGVFAHPYRETGRSHAQEELSRVR